MGLRPTHHGFGTPEIGGRLLRVEGDLLVEEGRDGVATRSITTVRDAAGFFGVDYRTDWFSDFKDPLPPTDPDSLLAVDRDAALFIADWFRLGDRVLEELRTRSDDEVSETQLWPEHFDVAVESGAEQEGRRASYGFSPGDHAHAEPYAYVSAWGGIDRSDPYWNDDNFNGASLGHREVAASQDPVDAALDFMFAGYRALHRPS
jgi:hypothetical protein